MPPTSPSTPAVVFRDRQAQIFPVDRRVVVSQENSLAVDPGRGRGVDVLADQAGAGVEHLGKTILEALP